MLRSSHTIICRKNLPRLKVSNYIPLGAVFQLGRALEVIQPKLRNLRVKRVVAVLPPL
jgi:hypothetical protein